MPAADVAVRVDRHLRVLVQEIRPRPAGSPANRGATDYLVEILAGAGLPVAQIPFTCVDWEPGAGHLHRPDAMVAVAPGPYSHPCCVRARVRRVSTRAELDAAGELAGAVVVLDRDLAAEPYFPIHFPFLALPEQQEIIAALEAAAPAAVLAVMPAGRPFAPRFEDADLTFPYATVTGEVGERLRDGDHVELVLGGTRRRGAGVNVSAGTFSGPRIVISAHVDTKPETPGAIDNAGGVAVLLVLAESGVLDGAPPIELVFFNGEDHHAAPGEQAWLAERDLSEVRRMINIDGVGAAGRGSTVAALACPPDLEQWLAAFVSLRRGWTIAPPWHESDHAVFAMRGIPSLAFTSEGAAELAGITHSAADTVDRVDVRTLADVVAFIGDLIAELKAEAGLAPALAPVPAPAGQASRA